MDRTSPLDDDDVTEGHRSWGSARLGVRLRGDTQLLLAVAIAIPVLVMQAAGLRATWLGLLAPIVFVGAQLWLATLRISPP